MQNTLAFEKCPCHSAFSSQGIDTIISKYNIKNFEVSYRIKFIYDL